MGGEKTMEARWLGEDVYAGPIMNRIRLIAKGEIRKVHAKSDDGKYILQGRDGKGYFGWIEPEQIEILEVNNG